MVHACIPARIREKPGPFTRLPPRARIQLKGEGSGNETARVYLRHVHITKTGSDSDPELELEDQEARKSTSAVPTTGSDTSTTSSLLDRLRFVQYKFFLRII